MKTIAIYHAPQECGNPYVLLVNLEDGQVIKTINISSSSDYWYSGIISQSRYEMLDEYVDEKFSGVPLPEIGTTEYLNRRKREYMLESITDVKKKTFGINDEFVFYDAVLHYRRFRTIHEFRFSRSEDTFRQELEDQGIDMTGWCVYKRRKTDFKEFLKSILSDFNVVNVLNIG